MVDNPAGALDGFHCFSAFTSRSFTIQYTVTKGIGMSGYQNCKVMSAYHFGLTLVWQFKDIVMDM
jgi:hypothetical protein